MKKFIFSLLLFTFLLYGNVLAGPAYRNPITVRQPDGTPLTIVIHGDEFLHWMTSRGALVAAGEDGYYYYASFDSDGNSVPSADRVGLSTSLQKAPGIVTPPQSAIDKAHAKRADVMLNRRGLGNISSSGPSSSIQKAEATSKKKYLVILVDYKDRKFTAKGGGESARQLFDDMLNKQGFSEYSSVGSVADYYKDNSCNQFQPEFDVYGPYTVNENASTFTSDDGTTQNGAPLLLAKACTLADNDIDFSQYDLDNDGYIDNVNMIFAGYSASQGANNAIWPHRWSVYSKTYTFDGKILYDYSCSSEFEGTSGTNIDGIGTFCHEFGHILGLPDFYDTDYSDNGQATDLEEFSLMAYGCYNGDGKRPPYLNAQERDMLGWMGSDELKELDLTQFQYSLAPIQTNKAYSSPTQTANEYFLYEFRNGTGWDTGLNTGLFIYHVDRSGNKVGKSTAASLWNDNEINCYSDHQCMDLIEATSSYEPFGKTIHAYTSTSSPAAKDWAGRATGYDLTNISYTSESATFTLPLPSISGVVYDTDGKPIPGVTVTVSAMEAQPASSELMQLAPQPASFYAAAVTESDGSYYISLSSFSGNELYMTVSKSGYNSVNETVPISASVTVKNFTLIREGEFPDITLMKYDASAEISRLGNTKSNTLYGGVQFSQSELVRYQGYKVKNVSVMVDKSQCDKVEVLVYINGASVLDIDVTGSVTTGSLSRIDVSDKNIIIPSSGDIMFICKVSRTKNNKTFDKKYPLYADKGATVVSGGGKSSTNGTDWSDLRSNNFIISAELSADVLSVNGVTYLGNATTTYKAGDKFELSAVKSSSNPYESVTWEVNSQKKTDGEKIDLQKGVTAIKATVTYPGGRVEIIEMNIKID